MEWIGIERLNGTVALVRSKPETASEDRLTEHEQIINELFNKLMRSNIIKCDDWIHEERIKSNDDNYCPICGKDLKETK